MSDNEIFRKEAIRNVSTPDELNDYLHVTNPRVWAVLSVVIVLLLGVFSWSMVGDLESTADVNAEVRSGVIQVIPSGRTGVELKEGMILRVGGEETAIEKVAVSENGWTVGAAHVSLPDGSYQGTVVVENVKPISFLMESR